MRRTGQAGQPALDAGKIASSDAFYASAKQFAGSALVAHHAGDYRRVWLDAGAALEHLAKASCRQLGYPATTSIWFSLEGKLYTSSVSLFTQRLAAQQEAAARALDENVGGLIDEAPGEFRQQLAYAINRATSWPIGEDWKVQNLHRYLIQEIRQFLREEYGVPRLAAATEDPGEDLLIFILNAATTHQVMDVIDAVIRISADQMMVPGFRNCAVDGASGCADTVSRRMEQHKLAYDLIEFKVVGKRSEEIHAEVVAPALTLLHGRSRLGAALLGGWRVKRFSAVGGLVSGLPVSVRA